MKYLMKRQTPVNYTIIFIGFAIIVLSSYSCESKIVIWAERTQTKSGIWCLTSTQQSCWAFDQKFFNPCRTQLCQAYLRTPSASSQTPWEKNCNSNSRGARWFTDVNSSSKSQLSGLKTNRMTKMVQTLHRAQNYWKNRWNFAWTER